MTDKHTRRQINREDKKKEKKKKENEIICRRDGKKTNSPAFLSVICWILPGTFTEQVKKKLLLVVVFLLSYISASQREGWASTIFLLQRRDTPVSVSVKIGNCKKKKHVLYIRNTYYTCIHIIRYVSFFAQAVSFFSFFFYFSQLTRYARSVKCV